MPGDPTIAIRRIEFVCHPASWHRRYYLTEDDVKVLLSRLPPVLWELNPRFADALIVRGSAFRQKGHYDQAIADFGNSCAVSTGLRSFFGRLPSQPVIC